MSHGERIYEQLLSAAGLWLLLSHFGLMSQTSLFVGEPDIAILVSMSVGGVTLVLAVLRERHHRWSRSVLGVAAGLATLGGSWVLAYADQTLIGLCPSISGVAIASIAVADFFVSRPL